MRGVNMTDVKRSNRNAILRLLQQEKEISRKQLAARLNLTSAAITMIVNDMIEQGIVDVGRTITDSGSVGRKEMLLLLRDDLVGAGIYLGNDDIIFSAVNLMGKKVMEHTIPLKQPIDDHIAFLHSMSNILQSELKKANISAQKVVGLGVTIRGYVNSTTGRSENSLGLFKVPIDIKDVLEDYLPYEVHVENNVRGMALAQNYLDKSAAAENVIFIRCKYGIGGAILTNNRLYYGSDFHAGELGHVKIVGQSRVCRCGRVGCLETFASVNGMITLAKELYSEKLTPELYASTNGDSENITLKNIFEACERGDHRLARQILSGIEAFAQTIITCLSIIDAKKVILYGDVFEHTYYSAKLFQAFKNSDDGEEMCKRVSISKYNGNLEQLSAPIHAVNHYILRGGA